MHYHDLGLVIRAGQGYLNDVATAVHILHGARRVLNLDRLHNGAGSTVRHEPAGEEQKGGY